MALRMQINNATSNSPAGATLPATLPATACVREDSSSDDDDEDVPWGTLSAVVTHVCGNKLPALLQVLGGLKAAQQTAACTQRRRSDGWPMLHVAAEEVRAAVCNALVDQMVVAEKRTDV